MNSIDPSPLEHIKHLSIILPPILYDIAIVVAYALIIFFLIRIVLQFKSRNKLLGLWVGNLCGLLVGVFLIRAAETGEYITYLCFSAIISIAPFVVNLTEAFATKK